MLVARGVVAILLACAVAACLMPPDGNPRTTFVTTNGVTMPLTLTDETGLVRAVQGVEMPEDRPQGVAVATSNPSAATLRLQWSAGKRSQAPEILIARDGSRYVIEILPTRNPADEDVAVEYAVDLLLASEIPASEVDASLIGAP